MKIDHRQRTERGRVHLVILFLLLAATGLLELGAMRQESLTMDEPQHLVAGYAAWKSGDYRLQLSNGMLPERLFALPLLGSELNFPDRESPGWRKPDYLGKAASREFLHLLGNDTGSLVFRGRLMAMAVSLIAVLAIYFWTTRFLGPQAGLIATFFCALSPAVLAHGHLMTSDLTAALLFLMSAGCFWMLLRKLTWWRLGASAMCFGLLLVSKMSGALIIPIALLMFAFRVALRRPWRIDLSGMARRSIRAATHQILPAAGVALAHTVVAFAVIWTFYGWQSKPAAVWDPAIDDFTEAHASVFNGLGSAEPAFVALQNSGILPEAYVYGLGHTVKNAKSRPAFLNGHYGSTGWWYYFPYCFLVKSSPAFIALLLLGSMVLAVRIRMRRPLPRWLVLADRLAPVWSILLVYGFSAIATNLNIGVRHLLPLYLPLMILAGGIGAWVWRRKPWGPVAVGGLMVWQLVVVAGIHPHYLSYFNFMAGGPREGYLHLSDSNVDWGQDLPALARWLERHQSEISEGDLYFDYFGVDDPGRFGITALPLPNLTNRRMSGADPIAYRPGLFCISATALMDPGFGGPPWDEESEEVYVGRVAYMRQLERTDPPNLRDPENMAKWTPLVRDIATLQYRRLRSHLVQREPDAMAGYSILIYRVSAEELRRALLP